MASKGVKISAFIICWLWLVLPTSLILWLLSRVVTLIKFDWLFVIIISGVGALIFIYTIEKDENK